MLTDLLHSETDPVADARRILLDTYEAHQPSHVFGLFSGGNDSACACHVAASVLGDRFTAAVHINTETGLREARTHAQAVADNQGWRLLEYRPPTPEWAIPGETAYEAIVRRWGFPGPAGHWLVYARLKERCVRRLVAEHKQGRHGRIMLVGGMRLAESRRRMGNATEWNREGARVWCAPILRWEAWDKDAYMKANGLPRNPVTEKIGVSGECLCGAFACPGEFQRIELHYPPKAAEIRRWEEMASAHGVPCVWGERPPKAPDMSDEGDAPGAMELCWSCNAKAEKRPLAAPSPRRVPSPESGVQHG